MSVENIIVTGINGFVGEHLARYLKELGYSVTGIGREPTPKDNVNNLLDTYYQADLLDYGVFDGFDFTNSKAIIHLAGLASVADSFKYPDRYIKDNSVMTDNLLSSALKQGFVGRAVIISTGAIYNPSQTMPLDEDAQTIESSPYSIGKIAAEHTAIEYRSKGLDVVIVRPFNHIGPGQNTGFLLADLYSQVVANQHDNTATISVGSLMTRRDYTDVRDIVKAYRLLAIAPSLMYTTYNVSSGNSYSGQDIVNELSKVMGITIDTIVDPSRIRPTDAKEIIGNSNRIRNELGWVPSIELSKTITDFVLNDLTVSK